LLRKETIQIGEKKYETFLLEPEMQHVKGVFEKSENAKMHMWVTADQYKTPVRFKSKVFIGSFIVELVDKKNPLQQEAGGD